MNSMAKKLTLIGLLLLGLVTTVAYGFTINGELVKARFENLASNPTSPGDGRVIYDTTTDSVKYYNGSSWLTFADTGSSVANPMTTLGDMIVGGSSGAITRLATTLLGDISAGYGSFTFVDADVNTGTEVITESSHGLSSGQTVYLTNSGGALPGGLSASTKYYVISASSSTIKLATSRANAIAGTAINITSAAGGGTHTLVYGGLTLNSTGIPGVVDGAAATAGYVGEYKENNKGASVSVTNNTVGDIDSSVASWSASGASGIALTPGTWDIQGNALWSPAASTSVTFLEIGIGTATQTSTTGQDLTRNWVQFSSAAAVPGNPIALVTPVYRVNISSNTTYYLKARAIFTVSTMAVTGNIRATRIR